MMEDYEWRAPGGIIPLKSEFYKKIRDIVKHDTNYWVTDFEGMPPAYRNLVDESAGITEFVVFSLRGNLMKDKIVSGHFRIRSRIAGIVEMYRNYCIIELSKRFDYPPIYLLKAIFVHRGGMTPRQVDALFEPGASYDLISQRDAAQIDLAKGCDADINADAVIARQHELEFVAIFKGIPHKTEADLIKEGSKTTPDILFEPPISINGTLIHWIDYKDYVGAPGTFLVSKLRKQAEKYKVAHGFGAFAFNSGYVAFLDLGVMLLRAQDCPFGKFSPSKY